MEVLSGMTLVGRTSPPPPLLGVLFIVLGCSGTRRPTFVAAADVTRIVRCLGVRTAFHHECSAIGACSLSTPARRLAGPPTNPLPLPLLFITCGIGSVKSRKVVLCSAEHGDSGKAVCRLVVWRYGCQNVLRRRRSPRRGLNLGFFIIFCRNGNDFVKH